MAQFSYKGVDGSGTVSEGVLEASNRSEAISQVQGRGLKPIRVQEGGPSGKKSARANKANAQAPATSEGGDLLVSLRGPGKINARVLENFTRLLSSLLASGVPFSRALSILYREATIPVAKAKWKEIHDLVIDGISLSTAMARSPETFPRVYVAMVEAGETGGFLDVVLAQIADFQSRARDIRGKVMGALIYPAVLLVLAIAVLVFLLVFFIPRFQAVFKSFNADLPLLTQMIVGASQVVRNYGLFVAAGVVIIGLYFRNWFKSPKGRRSWEGFVLKLPVVGPLLAKFAMARFTRMLGTLLGAGVPLVNALTVAQRSLGNQILVDAVSESINRVKEGKALATSLAKNPTLFPGTVIEMISVGEESGKLDAELLRIAVVAEADLERELKTAVALAEPMMLFLIAALVGTIFIGMVYPIFSLTDHIK